ncbi:glycosyltransferase, partial [Clostridium disporicum]
IKYHLIYKLPAKVVYKVLFRKKFDVEVAFVEGFATKVISNSNNNVSKKISWIHVDPIERDYADLYFKNLDEHKKCYNKFQKIICVSNSVKDSLVKKYNISKEKVKVQYNPIDKESIILKANENCTLIDSNKFTIISVGRLVHQKGYDRLLKIINNLKNEIDIKFELIILGEGQERENLEQFIKANDLEEYVKLLGFEKNPYKFIKQADLFVCSSRAEGFSLVIAEALVLGIPVISTNCSGPNELLNFGEYGMLVDNNENDLYLALKDIISNNDLLEELKNKAKKRANSFNYFTTIKQIEQNILER